MPRFRRRSCKPASCWVVLTVAALLLVNPLFAQDPPNPPAPNTGGPTIDFSHWVSDSITLYYFDDIPRLMQVLNPASVTVGGQAALREAADTKRTELITATQDLATKRQEVNDARTELATKRAALETAVKNDKDALNKATAKATATSTSVLKLTEQQTLAQSDVDRAQADQEQAQSNRDQAKTERDQAKTDLAADMNNDVKKTALANAEKTLATAETTLATDKKILSNAKSRLTAINAKLATARAEDTTAQTAKTDAKTKLDTDLDEQTGLAGKVQQAENALKTAQTNVNGAMTASILAAEAANLAFARARDNVPFLASYPDKTGANDDPVHKVLLTGFPDSKTIFIRGNQADVDRVRELIMKFDRPQAQALMTLWTLEVSSDGTAKGAQRATEALKIIEQELRVARVQNDAALSLLRECINTAVAKSLLDYAKAHPDLMAHIRNDDREAVAFYDVDVLDKLGWSDEFPKKRVNTNFLHAVIPQPSGTTTLAEALVVLSLAKRSYQISIWEDFSSRVNAYINTSTKEALGASTLDPCYQVQTKFPNLKRFIGTGTQDGAGVRSFQREIVDQLERNAITPMLEYMRGLAGQKGDLTERQQKIISQILALFPNTPLEKIPPDKIPQELKDQQILLQTQLMNVSGELKVAFGWLSRSSRYQNDFLNDPALDKIANAPPADLDAQMRGFRNSSRFRLANAREAALNETLKKYIQAVDDDLQEQFTQPMFDRLRKRLVMEARVGVGVIQRTSILASNRLVARVDPSASAQLAVGEQQNILQETLQLTQLIASAQTGGLPSVLGGLDRLPPSTPPGVYGITTGNVFQVTPIADPTGQALRFRFDHVLSSPIREPNNTTNPQLSRIERHSINTEVQLSNNEIRTISQFDSNAQIGLPTRHSGGIPILRDLPILRDIPLIGWFTVSKGRAPIVQQSLVLGQTTIFPTIGDVIDLLTRPISFVDFNQPGGIPQAPAGGK